MGFPSRRAKEYLMATMEDNVEDFIERQLEDIDEQIDKINNSKVMRAAEKLITKRNILLSARRALLGGNALTGGSSSQVRQPDVVDAMKNLDGGINVAQLASKMNTTEAIIRGHLSRGNNERFLKKNNLWYLRDPEAGIDTVDDIED